MREEEMIQAIVSGGQRQDAALRALYAKGAEFRRHFLHKGVSQNVADDLVQDVIIRIFRNASQYQGRGGFGDGSANAWMWNIARNSLVDHFRSHKQISVSVDDETLPKEVADELKVPSDVYGFDALDPQAVDICVQRGLNDFAAKEPDRIKALIMQMDGMQISSIARLIERTEGATREYLSQCRKSLAPFIAHCTALLRP